MWQQTLWTSSQGKHLPAPALPCATTRLRCSVQDKHPGKKKTVYRRLVEPGDAGWYVYMVCLVRDEGKVEAEKYARSQDIAQIKESAAG